MTPRSQSQERPDGPDRREAAGTKHPPAGNAIHDPEQQTQRDDMPKEEQPTRGEPGRGSAPARPEDLPAEGMPRPKKGA